MAWRDSLGNDLNVGDRIMYPGSRWGSSSKICFGEIVKLISPDIGKYGAYQTASISIRKIAELPIPRQFRGVNSPNVDWDGVAFNEKKPVRIEKLDHTLKIGDDISEVLLRLMVGQ